MPGPDPRGEARYFPSFPCLKTGMIVSGQAFYLVVHWKLMWGRTGFDGDMSGLWSHAELIAS